MESWLHVPYLPLWAINYTQLCVLVHPDKMMLGGPANLWLGRCVRHNVKKPRHVVPLSYNVIGRLGLVVIIRPQ